MTRPLCTIHLWPLRQLDFLPLLRLYTKCCSWCQSMHTGPGSLSRNNSLWSFLPALHREPSRPVWRCMIQFYRCGNLFRMRQCEWSPHHFGLENESKRKCVFLYVISFHLVHYGCESKGSHQRDQWREDYDAFIKGINVKRFSTSGLIPTRPGSW